MISTRRYGSSRWIRETRRAMVREAGRHDRWSRPTNLDTAVVWLTSGYAEWCTIPKSFRPLMDAAEPAKLTELSI